MAGKQALQQIKAALEKAPRNGYVAEIHAQVLKHAEALESVSGKEFCAELGLGPAWSTEYSKMKKIAPRLRAAGMDPSQI